MKKYTLYRKDLLFASIHGTTEDLPKIKKYGFTAKGIENAYSKGVLYKGFYFVKTGTGKPKKIDGTNRIEVKPLVQAEKQEKPLFFYDKNNNKIDEYQGIKETGRDPKEVQASIDGTLAFPDGTYFSYSEHDRKETPQISRADIEKIKEQVKQENTEPKQKTKTEIKKGIPDKLKPKPKKPKPQTESPLNIVRIGDDYYKNAKRTRSDKSYINELIPVKRQTIIDDFGSPFLKLIPKFDSFCNVPDNQQFKQAHNKNYNLYKKFPHEPKKDEFKTIKKLFKHTFGSQYEMGLDYIQLLYENPTQILPVLSLVSADNQTGKTTFIEFLFDFFLGNVAIIGTSDIEGNFNTHFISKLIIAIDESDLHKQKTTSRIKQMATQKTAYRKGKFQNEVPISFFAKVIILSNDERNFISLKDEDIRYWIRKLKPLKKFDKHFARKLKSEIPAFVYFLNNRKLNCPTKKSRAWFDVKDLNTAWLQEAKYENKTGLYHHLVEYFYNWFSENESENELVITSKEIYVHFLNSNPAYNINYISRVLRDEFKIQYEHKHHQSSFSEKGKAGRYYTVRTEHVNYKHADNEADKNSLPF